MKYVQLCSLNYVQQTSLPVFQRGIDTYHHIRIFHLARIYAHTFQLKLQLINMCPRYF